MSIATRRHSLIAGQEMDSNAPAIRFSWPVLTLFAVTLLLLACIVLLRLVFLEKSLATAIRNPSTENRVIADAYRGPVSYMIGNELISAIGEGIRNHDRTKEELKKSEAFAEQAALSNIEMISFNPAALQRLQTSFGMSPMDSKESISSSVEKRLGLLPVPKVLSEELKLRQIRLTTGVISTLQFEAVDMQGTTFEGLTLADIAVTNADGIEYPFFAIDQVTAPLADCWIVVLVDKSSSMAGDRLLKLQAGLELLIANCSGSTRIEIVGFDSKVTPLTVFTNDHRVLTDAVRSIRADGATEISKALDHGLTELRDKLVSKSILLCTDGQDPNLASNMQRIIASCQRSKISINVLGLNDPTLDRSNLASLAKQSNGLFCVADSPLAITDQMNQIMSSYTKVAYRLFVFNPSRKLDRYRMRLVGSPTTFIDVQP